MAWNRSTKAEHTARAQGFLSEAIGGVLLSLRASFLNVLSKLFGGSMYLLEGAIENAARNIHATTADDESVLIKAAEYGLYRLEGAVSTGFVNITGTIGTLIEEGETLQRFDGVQYSISSDTILDISPKPTAIEAINPSKAADCAAGQELSFITPIEGVYSSVVVGQNGIKGGTDNESIETLRSRLIARRQNPPRAGSDADYLRWARELAFVTRAWVHRNWLGLGTVGISFVNDTRESFIPTTQEIADLQTYLDNLAPNLAEIIVFAPTPKPINFDLSITPDTPTIRSNIEAELRDFLATNAQVGVLIPKSQLNEIISGADGETDHVLNQPAANVSVLPNEIATFGSITFGV